MEIHAKTMQSVWPLLDRAREKWGKEFIQE